MHLLAVTQSYPKHPGDGTAPFIESIVSALVAHGHSFDIVLPYHPEFSRTEDTGVRFFPYRYSPIEKLSPWGFGQTLKGTSRVDLEAALMLPAVAVALRRRVTSLLSTERYDAVHAHWLLPNGWLAASPATTRRVPLVVSLHGSDVALAERNRFFRLLARRTLSAAGAVTACSEDLHRRAVALGADPKTTSTVHYGVDTTFFAPWDEHAPPRDQPGATEEGLVAVAIGRLVEKKGFRYLIEAAAQIKGIRVVIVGDGDLRTELETLARTLRVAVTFAGALDRDGVAAALAAADVVVVPSVVDSAGNVDGLPNTLLEALAAGRPVVASAIAGIPEVVETGVNGLLVPERDTDALAQALTALHDSGLRDALGRAARRRAVAELSWDATATAFEDAFSTARGSAGSAP